MKELLVSYETALLANEKGFNGLCSYIYFNPEWDYGDTLIEVNDLGSGLWRIDRYEEYHVSQYGDYILVPTQSLLQRWLREIHNIKIDVEYTEIDNNKYMYCVYKTVQERTQIEIDRLSMNDDEFIIYDSYEEALETALKEALSII